MTLNWIYRICLVAFLGLSAHCAWSQSDSVQVAIVETDTSLDRIFRKLRKQDDVQLAYDSRAMRDIRVSVSIESAPLETALNLLLKDSDYSWKLLGSTYVIFPSPQKEVGDMEPTRKNFTFSTIILDQSSGEPLPFANVRVEDKRVIPANSEGQVTIFNFPSDTSTIEVSFIGYESLRFQVSPDFVGLGGTIELMRDRAILPTAAIVGEQTRTLQTSTTNGLSTLNMDVLDRLPQLGSVNIIGAVQLLPGVNGTGESAAELHIRGGGADENLVTFDDFTLYHIDHFYGIFGALNGNSIKNVRLHRGWFPAHLGGRASGVLEITGKEGNKKRPRVSLGANFFDADVAIEVPLLVNEVSLALAARRAYTDILFSPAYKESFSNLYNGNLPRPGQESIDPFEGDAPDFSFYDVTAKLSIRNKPDELIQASFYSGRDNLAISYGVNYEEDFLNITYNDESRWGNVGGSLKWSKRWSEKCHSSFVTSYSQYSSALLAKDVTDNLLFFFTDSVWSNQEMILREGAVKFLTEYKIDQHQFTTGIEARYNEINFSEINSRDGALFNYLDNSPVLSAYVDDEFRGDERTSGNVGVRLSYYDGDKQIYFEPRLRLTHQLNTNTNLTASYGKFVQTIRKIRGQSLYLNTPDIWRLSNADDVPVLQSQQFQGGVHWSKKGWTVNAEAYFRWSDGVITALVDEVLPSDSALTSFWRGTGQSTGVELLLQREYGVHTGWISATLASTTYDLENLEYRVSAAHDQNLELKAVYLMRLPRWNLSATFIYGSGRPYTPVLGTYDVELANGAIQQYPAVGNFHAERLPAYHRLDLAANYSFDVNGGRASVGLSLFNVYNQQNIQDREYYFTPENNGQYEILSRDVKMLGFVPALNFRVNY